MAIWSNTAVAIGCLMSVIISWLCGLDYLFLPWLTFAWGIQILWIVLRRRYSAKIVFRLILLGLIILVGFTAAQMLHKNTNVQDAEQDWFPSGKDTFASFGNGRLQVLLPGLYDESLPGFPCREILDNIARYQVRDGQLRISGRLLCDREGQRLSEPIGGVHTFDLTTGSGTTLDVLAAEEFLKTKFDIPCQLRRDCYDARFETPIRELFAAGLFFFLTGILLYTLLPIWWVYRNDRLFSFWAIFCLAYILWGIGLLFRIWTLTVS